MFTDEDWRSQLRSRIRSIDSLPKHFPLTVEEGRFMEVLAQSDGGLSFLVTHYYLSLAGRALDDPIRKQFIPNPREALTMPYEVPDPLGEAGYSPCPRLIHRYPSRALLLVTGICALSCRHCFRRNFTSGAEGWIVADELSAALDYLAAKPEIKEILLSGGDPLVAEDGRIRELLKAIRGAREDIVIRIGTRTPAALPMRFTPSLLGILSEAKPLWISAHFNHPRELGDENRIALGLLADHGIPVLNQSVLLKGINDSPDILAELCNALVSLRVKPYYLFQGDLAIGTRVFRVPLSRGMEIYRMLSTRLSGLALPVYAIDLPGGGGKIPVLGPHLKGRDERGWIFEDESGTERIYPEED